MSNTALKTRVTHLKLKYAKTQQLTTETWNQLLELFQYVIISENNTGEALNAIEIRNLLQTLLDDERLDASAIKNLQEAQQLNAIEIRNLLQTLQHEARLDASAIKNLPEAQQLNAEEIRNLLQTLLDDERLDASAIKNLQEAQQLTAEEIRNLLQTLQNEARLDASAIKNLPEAQQLTAEEIRNLLQTLQNEARLDASAIKNLPEQTAQLTAEEIRDLLQSLLNTNRLDASAIKNLPENYEHPVLPNITLNLTGAEILSKLNVNNNGHVVLAESRQLTAQDIGACVIDDTQENTTSTWSSSHIQNKINAAKQKQKTITSSYIITEIDNNYLILLSSANIINITIGDDIPNDFYVEFMNIGEHRGVFNPGLNTLRSPDGLLLLPNRVSMLSKINSTNEFWLKGELE